MKKINSYAFLVAFVFLSSLFFSCGNNKKEDNTETTMDSTTVEKNPESINPSDEYRNFVATLDASQMSSSLQAAEKFKELYANATPEIADEGFLIFNALYDTIVVRLNDIHYTKNEYSDKYDEIAGIYNGYNDGKNISPEMKAYQEKLTKNGFGIGMVEGSTYYLQNRDFLKEYFYPKVSESLKEYLIQKNKEAKEMYASDGGLIISPTRLAERIIWTENFIKENPNFYDPLMEELKWSKKAYMTTLLEGMDNTPLFDYETKEMNQDFEEAYRTVVNSYADTETAALVKPYYEATKNKNTQKQKELLAKYQAEDKIYKNEY